MTRLSCLCILKTVEPPKAVTRFPATNHELHSLPIILTRFVINFPCHSQNHPAEKIQQASDSNQRAIRARHHSAFPCPLTEKKKIERTRCSSITSLFCVYIGLHRIATSKIPPTRATQRAGFPSKLRHAQSICVHNRAILPAVPRSIAGVSPQTIELVVVVEPSPYWPTYLFRQMLGLESNR